MLSLVGSLLIRWGTVVLKMLFSPLNFIFYLFVSVIKFSCYYCCCNWLRNSKKKDGEFSSSDNVIQDESNDKVQIQNGCEDKLKFNESEENLKNIDRRKDKAEINDNLT